jgi:hypothetical protein
LSTNFSPHLYMSITSRLEQMNALPSLDLTAEGAATRGCLSMIG